MHTEANETLPQSPFDWPSLYNDNLDMHALFASQPLVPVGPLQ